MSFHQMPSMKIPLDNINNFVKILNYSNQIKCTMTKVMMRQSQKSISYFYITDLNERLKIRLKGY